MAKKQELTLVEKSPSVAFVLHQEQIEFLTEAIDADNATRSEDEYRGRSEFIRDHVMAACKKVLGREPPEVNVSRGGGRSDAITRAAAEAGLSRQEFLKQTTLKALGLQEDEPARKRRRKSA